MNEELGTNPKWRWDELVAFTKRTFNLDFDVEFTNLFYEIIIVSAYSKNRHYHTLRHIEYLLKHVEDFNGVSHKDRNLLKWAIWFHDIIYDVTRTDNEERSANVLVAFAQALGFNEEDIEKMRWLILVTTHKGVPQTNLEDIICDLDLMELAGERYEKNAEEVRQEFIQYSDEEFREGRIKFLESMLVKEHIYHSDLFRESLEVPARHNISKELESINSQS